LGHEETQRFSPKTKHLITSSENEHDLLFCKSESEYDDEFEFNFGNRSSHGFVLHMWDPNPYFSTFSVFNGHDEL
jgi:hypothetical protein